MEKLAARGVTVMAMDSVPRISRAQSLDALSSMANIAGYRAIVEAAHEFGRFFTGQITAAGKVPPAKVMVIGAGVAGLAAIGAANSTGAIVRAFDTRPEVKEQVQSMGAEFLELDFKEEAGSGDGYAKVMSEAFIKAEMALFAAQAKEVDIIVTTALIPGKPAPKLITREMVDSMQPGSVIVDLAAQNGGNCEYTVPNQVTTTANGVKVIGYTDLPGRLPTQSSQLYGTNLVNLLKLLCKEKDGNITVDFDDVVVRGVTVVREGKSRPAPPIQVSAQPQAAPKAAPEPAEPAKPASPWRKYAIMALVIILFGWLADVAPKSSLATSPSSRSPAWWVTTSCGTFPMRCIPADVGHQCHLRDYRGRGIAANWSWRLDQLPELHCGADRQYQYFRWFHRDSAHAENVS